ncbi:MAG: ATP-dependent helicase HrpB [Gemmatimonadetes bacterium]|nr:ATP-dependent helicase HrpB [Gemmatimonadota bacterium]
MASDDSRSSDLPIEQVLPALHEALGRSSSAVLQAPPGAGKTTRVPLALLESRWLRPRRILMLEPRRLAARAAARRMASMLGESVGATVGFRVRGESRVGAATRIEVVTEGVLTRMLLDDSTLDRYGAVLFDEFHERSIHADLGLALTLQTQELLRPDLRILVMSATLDGLAISALLGNAPIITSEGRRYPVEVRHLPAASNARIEDAVALGVRAALARDAGSILAFLPGQTEIRRCLSALERGGLPDDVSVLPLYGDLSPAAQDAAIAPPQRGVRKVVLATSIAETSLTIEGVNIVIDSGLSRVSRFSARSGMSRLETVRVSRSSADQRSGRAGRTAPGVSYRLWPAEEDAHLPDRARPEILETDLASLALDLAVAGVHDPHELLWLDTPPGPALAQARTLLRELGALDDAHRITSHGREISSFGLHPRLAHMLLSARSLGLGATACVIAALLEERDVLRRDAQFRDLDLRSRVALVGEDGRATAGDVDRDAMRRVREQSRTWREQLRVPPVERIDEHATGRLLALAYPERVAQRRDGSGDRYLLRNGSGAVLQDPGVLANAPYLAIADLDGRSPQARIYLAAPIDREEIDASFGADIVSEEVVAWDADAGAILAVRRERLGAIILHEGALHKVDADASAQVIIDAVRRGDLSLPWSESAQRLRDRIAFLRLLDSAWPDFSEPALIGQLDDWLRPHLLGVRRRSQVEQLPMHDLLLGMLTWDQRRQLDELAPTHLVVPTGSRIPIAYDDPGAPVLAVRLQEMFGLADTPRIAGGRVPVTLHLLSPAHRPVQVTRDLAGFWRSSYFEVRKDLRGRYPKHEWPEDPLNAAPTRRAKPRK